MANILAVDSARIFVFFNDGFSHYKQQTICVNLVIDIGNTVAKIAVFSGEQLIKVERDCNVTLANLDRIVEGLDLERGIVASVIEVTPEVKKRLENLQIPLLWLDYTTPLPITNGYESPQTLGMDRIAAVVGANAARPGHDILVVDAGTCITFELIDASGTYLGGNISPGVQMRLKAMNQFTARLPLVNAKGRTVEIGKDTETAIRMGVLKGIEYEIVGYIYSLRIKYPKLLIFLTGGEEFSFDTSIKNIIFADTYLVLKGLNRILNYNNDRI